jgi:hypothetical protein
MRVRCPEVACEEVHVSGDNLSLDSRLAAQAPPVLSATICLLCPVPRVLQLTAHNFRSAGNGCGHYGRMLKYCPDR